MKNYFTFSKSQKIGVVAIVIVIFIQIIILNKGNAVGVPDPFVIDKSEYVIEEGNSFYYDKKAVNSNANNVNSSYVLFEFDPNEVSIEDWVSFGFSQKQAKSIISYKQKINGFKVKEDLKQVYVISDSKYAELEPYIKISANTETPSTSGQDKSEEIEVNSTVIDLNFASQEELIQVNGIGEFTAKGIIKYRKSLGGYHSVNQLKEVYGISGENFEKIKPQLTINELQLKTINVNQLSIQSLIKHPYINWNVAQAIVDKRLFNRLSSLQFLVENNYLSQEELNKVLPYVVYE